MKKDYYIGSGIAMFKEDGANGYFDFGNATDFKLTLSTETKKHLSTRSGLQKVDNEVTISQSIGVSITLDALKVKTLAMTVLGEEQAYSQTAGTLSDMAITVDEFGAYFDLGKRRISAVTVLDVTDTDTYVEGTDYEVLAEQGMIKVLDGGSIDVGDVIHVNCSYAAVVDRKKILAALKTALKGKLRFASDPAAGRKIDIDAEVSLQPSGDLSLIGSDFGSVTFSGETLGQSTGELATLLVEMD